MARRRAAKRATAAAAIARPMPIGLVPAAGSADDSPQAPTAGGYRARRFIAAGRSRQEFRNGAAPRPQTVNDIGPSIADPLLRQLYDYWRAKKGARIAPRRADIAPAEIPDLLAWVYLVELVEGRLRIRLAGTSIAEEFGAKLTGKYLDEIGLADAQTPVTEEYQKAAREIAPVFGKWHYATKDGRELDYERVILPLSSDGKNVDMFLCGAVGRGVG